MAPLPILQPGPFAGLVFALLLALGPGRAAAALELHLRRESPHDLELAGRLAGLESGGVRYVRWTDLRRLPTRVVTLQGEFVAGEQAVTVVLLEDLWRELPVAPDADALVATCTDGYASIYPQAFIQAFRPFLILEIEGEGPEHWPPPGLRFNPAPYVITVAEALAPGVGQQLDIGHKRPWGVTRLDVVHYRDRLRAMHEGGWQALSPEAEAGRDLWVNSCLSCHAGPGESFGGTKSGRPFAVVAAHAAHNAAYFKRYVRDPAAENPAATMEAHPHYTDAQLDALIAFITAGAAD